MTYKLVAITKNQEVLGFYNKDYIPRVNETIFLKEDIYRVDEVIYKIDGAEDVMIVLQFKSKLDGL